MIFETLQILKEQLDNYLNEAGLGKNVILDNVGLLDSGSDKADNLSGKVILSLINIQEETTLKNTTASKVVNERAEYFNPAVYLNIYFMVAANCDSYDKALISISKTIEFFQGKKVFTQANTVYDRVIASMEDIDEFRFVIEMYSPGFEVWNHIWGMLGGRQIPSVIYKVQLLNIDRQKRLATSELITEINGTLNDIRK